MPDNLKTKSPSEIQSGTISGVAPADPPGYELLEEVGRGGMGVVYRARDVALVRDVAVKFLAEPYVLDSFAAQRFVNEARITGQLQHPGIPAVHQVGHLSNGRPFLAMKLIKGSTLEAVLKERPDPSAERGRLLAVFEAVCQAVGYAHAHQVIHRDLKPANVMVGAFGEVQVMDWGLAKVLGKEGAPAADLAATEVTQAWTQVSPTPGAGSHTQEGGLLGTPAFIPPEQAAGELAKVDERADVFGLGAILTVILTGKPPYVGENFESVRLLAVRGKLDDCMARLDTCGAEPELVSLCRHCLAFEPADRPREAREVAQAVARLRSLAEERARTAERENAAADARSEEQRRKRWWQLAAAGMVVVALVGGLVGLGAYLRAQVQANAKLAAANESEKQAKEELETNLYFYRIALAHRELLENSLLKAEELLDQCPEDRRAWEWFYLKRLCRVEPVTVRGQSGLSQTLAFSPDGKRITSTGGDNTLRILNATTGDELFVLPNTEQVKCAAFRPGDGRWLVTGDGSGEITVWDTTNRTVVHTLGRHEASVHSLAFNSDGRLLASASADKTVKIWDTKSNVLIHALRGHEGSIVSVAFSPDGQMLASSSWDMTVKVWDTKTGKLIHTLRGHRGPVVGVAASPDGRHLASVGLDRSVKIWDMTTGLQTLSLRGHTLEVTGVAFLDNGRRLASVSSDKTMLIWDTTTGHVILTLRSNSQEFNGLVSSPDGRRLASASGDGTSRIWDATPLDLTAGQESLTLLGHTDQVWDLTFSPDGRRIASTSWDATVRVWDARIGREDLAPFRNHIRFVFGVAFSPDGRRIASGSAQLTKDEPSPLKIWDATTGQEVLQPRAMTMSALGMAFSPGDGRWLVTGTEGSDVSVWDALTGTLAHTLKQSPNVWGVAFSPDGERLATLSRAGIVTVYDATRWGERSPVTFRAHTIAVRGSLAFDPSGQRLVVPGDDNKVHIWAVPKTDMPPSAPQLSLSGHAAQVVGVAFSTDGRWVASCGEDNAVKLWDATTGKLIRTFRGHSSSVNRVAFSPDGKLLASASFDKTIKVWDLTPVIEKLKE